MFLKQDRFLHVHIRADFLDFRLHALLYVVDVCHVEDVDFEFERLRYFHPSFVLLGALPQLNGLRKVKMFEPAAMYGRRHELLIRMFVRISGLVCMVSFFLSIAAHEISDF